MTPMVPYDRSTLGQSGHDLSVDPGSPAYTQPRPSAEDDVREDDAAAALDYFQGDDQ